MFQRISRLTPQYLNRGYVQKTRLLLETSNYHSSKFRNFGESRHKIKNWSTFFKDNLSVSQLCVVFSRQCHVLMAQRIRRIQQTLTLCRNLYGDRMIAKLIDRLSGLLLQNFSRKRLCVLLSASLFSWQNDNITNEDCDRCVDEMDKVSEFVNHASSQNTKSLPGGWESVINKPHLKVWRKPIDKTHLYEYRVYGSYEDIPARAFYNVQVDLEFWKSWEKMALDINIVDKHKETGTEIVHWLTKFPYPMYSREYLYVRKCMEDTKRNVFVVNARAIQHSDIPITDQYVRVTQYLSQMVIKPHTTADQNGFDYILTYFDDPQSAFPSFCYNWLASSGVPEFVENLHKAAQKMNEKMKKGYKPNNITNKNNNNQVNDTPFPHYA